MLALAGFAGRGALVARGGAHLGSSDAAQAVSALPAVQAGQTDGAMPDATAAAAPAPTVEAPSARVVAVPAIPAPAGDALAPAGTAAAPPPPSRAPPLA